MKNMLSRFYEDFHRERGKQGTVLDPHRVDFIVNNVGMRKRVLDVGCRYCDLTRLFSEHNYVTGIDIDEHALEVCGRIGNIQTSVQDLNGRLAFSDMAFDVVVMSEVLEHLPYPDITLSEIVRVLKPGGRLVGSVPNATRLKNRLRFLFSGDVDEDRTHLFHYSQNKLRQLLAKHFAQIRIESVSGRLAVLSPGLFGNFLLFLAIK
jgi:SAM-dependent methyltransferase